MELCRSIRYFFHKDIQLIYYKDYSLATALQCYFCHKMNGSYVSGPVSGLFDLMYSVQFSRSVMSDSLQPHESQHVRPPCPSLTPVVHSDSHPSSQ